MSKTCIAIAAAASLALAGSAFADVPLITFSGLEHGRIVTNQFAGLGVTISANNPSRSFDYAAIFDTTRTGTADSDLEDPWNGGNIPANTILGNILIIAENNTGAGDGILNNPDDEGNRPAGSLAFVFANAINGFGFDVVDIEDVVAEASRVEFFKSNSSLGSIDFSRLVTPGDALYDPTIDFGDNHANRIAPLSIGGSFDKVVIHLGGSGGVDNIVVPTPATAPALATIGLFAARRRRAR
jgi:hypothetical protein